MTSKWSLGGSYKLSGRRADPPSHYALMCLGRERCQIEILTLCSLQSPCVQGSQSGMAGRSQRPLLQLKRAIRGRATFKKGLFERQQPELEDLDELNILASAPKGDASALRKALLWTDLKRNASQSPKALLGMLDVLSSVGRQPWDLSYFADLLSQTLGSAKRMPADEYWQFLQALVRKLGGGMPLSTLRSVFKVAGEFARSSPALIAAAARGSPSNTIPHLLRPAVARGLADLGPTQLSDFLSSADPSAVVSLMAESPRFAEQTSRALSAASNATLARALSGRAEEDPRSAQRVALPVAKGALSSKAKSLLRVCIRSAPRENFPLLANAVLSNGGFNRPALLRELIEAASSFAQEDALRSVAIQAPDHEEGDFVLFGLTDDRNDVAWLIDNFDVRSERLHRILLAIIADRSDAKLRDLMNAGRHKDAFLTAVVANLPETKSQFGRLLKLASTTPASTVSLLRRASEALSDKELVATAMPVLDRVFAAEPSSALELIQPVLEFGDPARVIAAATSSALSGAQIGANVGAITSSPFSSRFVPRVDLITAKLIERRSGGYGQTGYDAWASLLRKARRDAAEALIRSADPALEYCLDRRREPAGAVVAAAFPIVHARLSKKSNLPDIPGSLFAVVVYASMALFGEWDRAKEARNGLVDAFLKSTWEPVELLMAAVDAKATDKVLGSLTSRVGGRDYLRKIERGLSGYPLDTQKILKKALSDFKSHQ